MYPSRPELAIEVEKLANVLRQLSIGEVASYAAIDAAIGAAHHYVALGKARKLVEAETGLRFETVHRVGIKKIDASSASGIGTHARKRISKIAKVQCARLAGLKYNDISPEQQKKIDMERSLLGAISVAASAKTAKLVETKIQTGPILPANVFDLVRAEK